MKEPKLRFKADDGAKFPDWEKNNFSDVFDSINNSTFSRDCLNYVDGNVKYIHYGDILTIFDSTVNAEASNVPYVNKDIDCQKYQLLADGDIIVADTAEDDTVGKSVEITNASNVKMISGLHTIACRPKLKFASGYLGYYMNSNPYHNQLRPYMQGIKVTSISKANIALTNVSIPSLLEQQKIASLFTELDNLIQSAEKELDGYRELKQCMLQKMFPKKDEKVPEIRFPEFTGDWEQRKVGDICKTYSGGTPKSGKSSYYDNGTIPFIRSGEIHNDRTELYITEDGMNESSAKMVDVGDILYALYGATSGEVDISKINGAINQAILCIKPTTDFDRKFIVEILRHNKESILRTYLQGGQGNLSAQIIQSQIFDFPCLAEQQRIGEYFSNLDNLITIQQKELDGYKEFKKGLLQQMFC